MKKLLNKLKRKPKNRPETGGRITNETVAEHRERVLAGGRKFKYPLQYTKHKILLMSLVLSVLTLVALAGFVAWQLYTVQSTDKFMYRLTQVVPVPVAQVDTKQVRYSDYLLELRSAIHYLTTKEAINFSASDGKRQLEFQKRLALNKAIENAYIANLAVQQGITVTEKEVDDIVKRQLAAGKLGVSEEVYKQVIRDYYDWSFEEYKASLRKQLLRKKVVAKIDTDGRQLINKALERSQQVGDFNALAKELLEGKTEKGEGGDVGFVSPTADDPHGLVAAAQQLQIGGVSGVIEGADGFYLVKLLEKRENGDLHLARIFVRYTAPDKKIAELRKQSKVQEYIKVQPDTAPLQQQ